MHALLIVAVLASAIDIAAWSALGHVPPAGAARTLVALAPLPGDLLLVALIVLRIRRLDEFQQRIHFEAVVAAFLSTGVAVFVYGYLRKAALVDPLTGGLVWVFMVVSYAIGYAAAVRHYR